VTHRLTVIQCPSVDQAMTFKHEPCTREACTFWKGHCTAATDTEEAYAAVLDRDPDPGDCPLAPSCRWHVQAVQHGQTKCVVRRLGMICEHQGGDWNTFEMAEPEEWLEFSDAPV
jgi:hypothetical protein